MIHLIQNSNERVTDDVPVHNRDDDTKALFRCIVTLDYFRILSRLRSRHAKKYYGKRNKRMLITLLNETTHDKSVQPNLNITVSELEVVRAKVKALEALFTKFEDIQEHSGASPEVQDVAMGLITNLHDLATQTKLKLALNSSSKLNPSLKTSLPEAVMKLGRYYTISHELVCAARNKKYSLFDNVTIEASPIRRPSHVSHVDNNFNPLVALENMLQPRTSVQAEALEPSLERCLGKPASVTLDEFRLAIANYHKFAKVHAEIQLLFFYELNPGRLRPRVICSSKSACYLCDLFFKLHGQFYIPRTHGRLYERWTLPDWHHLLSEMRRHDFNVLLKQFIDALKVKIRTALEGGPVRVNHPNESVLVMPAHWSPSNITNVVPSVSGSVATLHLTPKEEHFPEALDGIVSNRPISEVTASSSFTNPEPLLVEKSPQLKPLSPPISSSSTNTLTLHPQAQELISPRDFPPSDTSIGPSMTRPHIPLSLSSTATLNRHEKLTQGESIWRQISHPSISINVSTNRLSLHLSCNTNRSLKPDIRSNPSDSCWVRVQWLQDTDFENNNSQTVNVHDLAYDNEMRVHHGGAFTPTELHLRLGEDVVSIKYTFDRPRLESAREKAQSPSRQGETLDGKDGA